MTTLVFDGVATSARTVDENGYMHVSDCPVTKEQVAPYYGYEIPQGERFGINLIKFTTCTDQQKS